MDNPQKWQVAPLLSAAAPAPALRMIDTIQTHQQVQGSDCRNLYWTTEIWDVRHTQPRHAHIYSTLDSSGAHRVSRWLDERPASDYTLLPKLHASTSSTCERSDKWRRCPSCKGSLLERACAARMSCRSRELQRRMRCNNASAHE